MEASHLEMALASLNDLEYFVLHDPSACAMYKQFLAASCPTGRKAHHVDFFKEIAHLEEKEWRMSGSTKRVDQEAYREELLSVFRKYFLPDSTFLLDIPEDWLEKVRENVRANVNLVAFRPAIRMVVKDLAFVYFESFIQSAIFKDYKESVLAPSGLLREDAPRSPREKQRVYKLRNFFGEKVLRDAPAWKRRSLEEQPDHIKEYKLSKKFGERVGVEKTSLLRSEQVEYDADDDDDEGSAEQELVARRHRRLHVFFGDNFEVDDTLFSERMRAQENAELSSGECQKQPEHVNKFRLARFFGQPLPSPQNNLGHDVDGTLSRHSRTRHLHRFFGERMDPAKEARAIAFATQPSHVTSYKLKKIFGESAAHTINFSGGTWPRSSRAKLEKIFGPFDD